MAEGHPAHAVTWQDVEATCPELAGAVRARFAAHPHHVLGTLDRAGAPRLSGVNVLFDEGEMWLGSMPGARKVRDLGRDPRCSVHSAPLDVDLAGGDAKVRALAEILPPDRSRAWLVGHGHEATPDGEVVVLRILAISVVEVDGPELHVRWWTPATGVRSIRRS